MSLSTDGKSLQNSKTIEKFAPHVQRVKLVSGNRRILKYPHEGNNSEIKIRELTCELSVSELLAYGEICNEPILRFHDLELCLEKDDYEHPWSLFDTDLNIKVINSDQFPLAFVIDWATGQQDRSQGSVENARLQKLEDGSYLFAPTDNGNSLVFNPDWKPDSNIDSNYSSNLLFSKKINSKEDLAVAINEFKSWQIKAITYRAIEKIFNCGCTFSIDKKEFILSLYLGAVNFIEAKKGFLDNLLSWYDETHPTIQQPEQLIAAQ